MYPLTVLIELGIDRVSLVAYHNNSQGDYTKIGQGVVLIEVKNLRLAVARSIALMFRRVITPSGAPLIIYLIERTEEEERLGDYLAKGIRDLLPTITRLRWTEESIHFGVASSVQDALEAMIARE